ncbi:MAG: cysteine desulfurase [Gammaproteobacteria bacterium]|nr:cysteine desulfurase [Gammaproteobacteria bacterium]
MTTSALASNPKPFNVDQVRRDFPLLTGRAAEDSIVYLDNAATTQKPQVVLDSLRDYYERHNANVHRGLHTLSDEATAAFESARATVANFVNAKDPKQVLWTKGTTESINLVGNCLSHFHIQAGDIILISEMEHHSNIVPWQFVAEQTGAIISTIPVLENGALDTEHYEKSLKNRVRLVALTHVSNALGTVNPVKEMIKQAHEHNALVVIDGAQAAAHIEIDVQDLDCDFYVFSAHKMYGPTGIGVLYGKEKLLQEMPPWQGGGEMIESVSFERTTYQHLPYKFEAGTPDISGAIATAASIDYLENLPRKEVSNHEHDLLKYATSKVKQIEGLRVVGTSADKGPILSFLLDEGHPHDVGVLLNQQNVAVRTGHHCAMPLMESLGIPGTVRASFALYNTKEDVDRLVSAIDKASRLLR